MNPKRRSSYGVLTLSRDLVRRVPAHWQAVETPRRPHALLADVIPLRSPDRPPTPGPVRTMAA